MRKKYPKCICTFYLCLFAFLITDGQCQVSIQGVARTGALLKACSKDTNIETLTWQLNGNPVFKTYNSGFNFKGKTAAGSQKSGSGSSQLYAPADVSVDAAGNLYILDAYNNRVQKFAPGSTTGVTVAGGNGEGSASNQLFLPQGFFVDPNGNIYIADLYNHRIQKWTPGSTTGITVAGGHGYGAGANQLAFPRDVFVDKNGNIYITDGDNNRVQKWAPGASSGVTVAGGNGFGSGSNQLNSPYSVFVDDTGNIYVSDRANFRIQKWAPGASDGVTVAGGRLGSDSTELNNPKGIYVARDGTIFIADYFNNRIQKWIPGSSYGVTVAGITTGGTTAIQFYNPSGVCVSPSGDLYVSDEGNNRIQKFAASTHINRNFIPQEPGTYCVTAKFKNGCAATSGNVTVTETGTFQRASSFSGASDAMIAEAVTLYPNPVRSTATLSFSSMQVEKYVVDLTDATGKNVIHLQGMTSNGSTLVSLNLDHLANGLYIVNLIKGEKEIETLKLVKE